MHDAGTGGDGSCGRGQPGGPRTVPPLKGPGQAVQVQPAIPRLSVETVVPAVNVIVRPCP